MASQKPKLRGRSMSNIWAKKKSPNVSQGVEGREELDATQSEQYEDEYLGKAPETSEYGFTTLREDPEASIDIVAVHGLNGHREHSWTASNGKLWLRDFLPVNGLRVLSYGYDSRMHGSPKSLSHDTLYGHGKSFVSRLSMERQLTETEGRPIIFIAHSLGGILVKNVALIHANGAGAGAVESHNDIERSTYGILFLATPHQGGNGAKLSKVLLNMVSTMRATNTSFLNYLESNSESLAQQLGQYGQIGHRYRTKFFYEMRDTPIFGGTTMRVVPQTSAVVPGSGDAEAIGLNKDHKAIVKFEHADDGDYRMVAGTVNLMCKAARHAVDSRVSHTDQELEILKWISPVDAQAQQENAIADFMSGTGNWLLEKNAFSDWRNTESSKTLWLHGPAKYGKTMLSAMLVEKFQSEYASTHPVLYYYCGQVGKPLRDATSVLRALLKQLAGRGPLEQCIVDSYTKKKPDKGRWHASERSSLSFNECYELLVKLACLYENTTIIIDGLNRMDRSARQTLLSKLHTSVEHGKAKFKLLVVGRDDKDVTAFFEERDVLNIAISLPDIQDDFTRIFDLRYKLLSPDGVGLRGEEYERKRGETCDIVFPRTSELYDHLKVRMRSIKSIKEVPELVTTLYLVLESLAVERSRATSAPKSSEPIGALTGSPVSQEDATDSPAKSPDNSPLGSPCSELSQSLPNDNTPPPPPPRPQADSNWHKVVIQPEASEKLELPMISIDALDAGDWGDATVH